MLFFYIFRRGKNIFSYDEYIHLGASSSFIIFSVLCYFSERICMHAFFCFSLFRNWEYN